ncbi:MAG TPA: PaaI family thioesterase [Gemmatimonadaceae bacterium]
MSAINPLTNRPVGTVPLAEVFGQAGVDFLRAMMEGRYPQPPIAAVMPIALVDVEVGRVVFRALPNERFYNPIGSVHGGYASMLLDTAMGCAVQSTLKAGEGYATLEIKIAFHKPILHDTGELRIEGTILSRGARVGAAQGRITDAKGDLIASGTTTCLIFQASATGASPTR